MTKHTPRPWTANLHHTQEVGGRTYGFITADGIAPVAAVVLGVEGAPQDEGRDNARLIAAAPDMLEAVHGEPDMPDAIRPLSWLRSMIDYCRERIPPDTHEDPDALWTMVEEVEELHKNATAAVVKATGIPRP